MNTISQLDAHPEVDILNAFAEHALSQQEREHVLEHLAGCTRCRKIVYLGTMAADEVPSSTLAAQIKLNFFGWFNTLRTSAVALAACAAIVTVIFLLTRTDAPTQQARAQEAEAARHTTHTPLKQESSNPQVSRVDVIKPETPAKPITASRPMPQQRRAALPVQALPHATEQPSAQSASPSPIAVPLALSESGLAHTMPMKPMLPQHQSETVNVSVSAESSVLSTEQAVSAQELQIEPSVSGTKIPLLETKTVNSLKLRTPSRSFNTNMHPIVSSSRVGARPSAATNRITNLPISSQFVASESTIGSQASTPEDAELVRRILYTRLPGGLTAISTASAQHHLIALDASGALFRSEDNGVTWSSIAPQWKGHALEVRILSPSADKSVAMPFANKSQAIPVIQAPYFEIITGDATTWTSIDGTVWTLNKSQ